MQLEVDLKTNLKTVATGGIGFGVVQS